MTHSRLVARRLRAPRRLARVGLAALMALGGGMALCAAEPVAAPAVPASLTPVAPASTAPAGSVATVVIKRDAVGQVRLKYHAILDPQRQPPEVKEGRLEEFYPATGQLKREATYANNVTEGEERWYFANGRLWLMFTTTHGRLNGAYQEYDLSGALIRSLTYADGAVVPAATTPASTAPVVSPPR